MREFKSKSTVSLPAARSLKGTSAHYVPFSTQPKSRHYAINANLRFDGISGNLAAAGFRVLASDQEYTDIYFDANGENLIIERSHSSLIKTCTSRPFSSSLSGSTSVTDVGPPPPPLSS